MFAKKNSNLFVNHASFLLFKSLRKDNGKFKHLLENLISEMFFLTYVYKTIVILPNYVIQPDFARKTNLGSISTK